MSAPNHEGEPETWVTPAAEWLPAPRPAAADVLAEQGLDPLVAGLVATRGVSTVEEAERFLTPHVDHLHDPLLLLGMRQAIKRLLQARVQGERVAVVGDYDVDGVSGTALLAASLRACKLSCEWILPHRLRDGYGFQLRQVDQAAERGCTLVVTVDCGTTSAAAIAACRERGIDVIVTDHHLPGSDFPADVIQINPKQPGDESPNPDLCGAGLAFKLSCALFEAVGRPVPLASLLRIAVLGTVADVVPLVGENRTIAALGLRALDQARSPGLQELMRVASVKPPLRAQDIGYRLGPRINAAGRLDAPDHALELLLATDASRARVLAEALDGWNQERQGEERRVLEQARRLLTGADPSRRGEGGESESALALPGILVAWSEEWHRGVVGIAAGRLARELHRPTILLAVDGDLATGSGRSIAGVHLYDFLSPWRTRLERFGGHDHAIGLTLRADRLGELRHTWQMAAKWDEAVLRRRLEYELHFDRGDRIDTKLFELLQRLEPYGAENPVPLIRLGPLRSAIPPRVFGNGHLKLVARDETGSRVDLVAWHGERWLAAAQTASFEVLGELGWDDYLGRPSLTVSDLRPMREAGT